MKIINNLSIILFCMLLIIGFSAHATTNELLTISGNLKDSVSKISKNTLKRWLRNPDLIILDVREPGDWENSSQKILGSIRETPDEVMVWAEKYSPNSPIVLYDTRTTDGISTNIAIEMMEMGFNNVFVLADGWDGWINIYET